MICCGQSVQSGSTAPTTDEKVWSLFHMTPWRNEYYSDRLRSVLIQLHGRTASLKAVASQIRWLRYVRSGMRVSLEFPRRFAFLSECRFLCSTSPVQQWNTETYGVQISFSFSCRKTKKPENLRPPEHFSLRFLSPPSLTKSYSYLVVDRRKCRWPFIPAGFIKPLPGNGQTPYTTHFYATIPFLWMLSVKFPCFNYNPEVYIFQLHKLRNNFRNFFKILIYAYREL